MFFFCSHFHNLCTTHTIHSLTIRKAIAAISYYYYYYYYCCCYYYFHSIYSPPFLLIFLPHNHTLDLSYTHKHAHMHRQMYHSQTHICLLFVIIIVVIYPFCFYDLCCLYTVLQPHCLLLSL